MQEPKPALAADFVERLRSFARAAFRSASLDGATPEEAIERVIALRAQARARKDFAASDRLRDALAANGVAIHDGKDGTTWSVAE